MYIYGDTETLESEKHYLVDEPVIRYVQENFDDLDKKFKRKLVSIGRNDVTHNEFVNFCINTYQQERYD